MKKFALVCYCCGEQLSEEFVLVTARAESDRVFVMNKEHIHRVGKDYRFISVRLNTPEGR